MNENTRDVLKYKDVVCPLSFTLPRLDRCLFCDTGLLCDLYGLMLFYTFISQRIEQSAIDITQLHLPLYLPS